MSNLYPNFPLSNFPDEVDKFERMQDITTDDVFLIKQYQGYIQNNNISKAQELLQKNPSLNSKIFNAEKFNKVSDSIQTLQRFFRDNVQEFVITWKDVIVEDINSFDYKNEYVETKQYKKNNFVTYKTSSGYHVFIALKDNIGITPLNRDYWKQLTITGAKGENGKNGIGFTFNGTWNEKNSYEVNTAVQHKGKLYGAKKQNINVIPDSVNDSWELIFDFQTLAQIQESTKTINVKTNTDFIPIPNDIHFNSKTDVLMVQAQDKQLEDKVHYTLHKDIESSQYGIKLTAKIDEIISSLGALPQNVKFKFTIIKNALLMDLIESFEIKDGSITTIKLEDTLMQKINYIDKLDAVIKDLQGKILSNEEVLKIKNDILDNNGKIKQLEQIIEGLPSTSEFNSIQGVVYTLKDDITNLIRNANDYATNSSLKTLSTKVDAMQNQLDSSDSSILTKVFYAVTTGAVTNSYEINIPEVKGVVPEGLGIALKIHSTNTGSASLNVNGLGAKIIKNPDGTTIKSNELKAGSVYTVRYNNVNFILQGRKEVIKEIEKLSPSEYGTASISDVVKDKTILTPNGLQKGTMQSYNAWTSSAKENGIISIPKGYHDGNGKINVSISNLNPSNIRNGVNVGGVLGSYKGNEEVSNVNLPSANQVLEGVSYGKGQRGTMPNNGGVYKSLTRQGERYNIPNGYHNGNGSVSVNISNLTSSNIRSGVEVGGIRGSYQGQSGAISRMDTGSFRCNYGYGSGGGGTVYGATFERPVDYYPDIVIITPTPLPTYYTKDNFSFSGLVLYWSNGRIDGRAWKPVGNSSTIPKIITNNGTQYGMRFNEGYTPEDSYWSIVVYSWSSTGLSYLSEQRFNWIAMKK